MAYVTVRSNCTVFLKHMSRCMSVLVQNPEYSDKPEYPPIFDTSRPAQKEREKLAWHEKIKGLKTVEEKLIEVNMPRYYGWFTYVLNEDEIPFNSLPFAQYVTRTCLRTSEELPTLNSSGDLVEQTYDFEKVKSDVKAALLFDYQFRRRKHEHFEDDNDPLTSRQLEEISAKNVVTQINRIIMANLSSKYPHLLRSQVDDNPRVESFWFVGGIEPTLLLRKMRRGCEQTKHTENDPVDRAVQYLGSPVLHIRNELPLQPVVDLEESCNTAYEVPVFQFDPRVLGLTTSHRHGTNIPGFWPGDPFEFGLLSFHHRSHLLERPSSFGAVDQEEALHVQAILASYSWLLSQACYQGFSTFNDLTYPLVTQTVISNGQDWSFYLYQLNTTSVHSQHATNNPRRNLCWGTGTMKLFESVENGEIVGFNDNVLKKLLACYTNIPSVREDILMKPYLGGDVKHVADIVDQERRNFLEKCFKHICSNRPRHRLGYEVYNWEKIYKIDHKTRPMEARRRPFELDINPYLRRMDDHVPNYIPKALRDENDKKRKFAKTYYP